MPYPEWIKQQKCIFQNPGGASKSKIKCQQGDRGREGEEGDKEREEENKFSGVSYKITDPVEQGPHSCDLI